jgi:PAS domain-containing protein
VANPGCFREREIALSKEVAMDVSFALDRIEGDTERERLCEQSRSHSTFLGTLMDAMPFPVSFKDAQLRYLGCNKAYERFVGIERDRLVGKQRGRHHRRAGERHRAQAGGKGTVPRGSPAQASPEPTQIHQVLLNLCTNAAHGMSDNGGTHG